MLIIKNGKIVTMADWLIDGGDIIIEGGIIRDITDSPSYTPVSSDIVIDAEDKFVFPGFIDVHTHCGLDGSLVGDIYRYEQFISPQTATYKYVNADSDEFSDCIRNGITSVVVAPFDEQIVGGKCCVVKTSPDIDQRLNVVSSCCGTKFSLCSMTDEHSVISPYRVPHFIRDELHCAQNYLDPNKNGAFPPLPSPALESYRPILKENMSAFISVSDADQIKIAKQIIDSFSLNGIIVLQDMIDSDNLYAALSENKIPLVINPMHIGTSERKQLADIVSSTGVNIAISTSHPSISSDVLPVNAGIFVRDGLAMQSALEAITVNPAEMCNVSDRIGTLRAGMDADIVIFDGNPLEVLSTVMCTIIDGRVVYTAQ